MVRRKKIKSKTKRISFKTGTSKKKYKTNWPISTGFLKVLAVICVFAALAGAFVFLERYVKKVAPAWGKTVDVELVEPPAWVNQPLRDKIIAAATVGGEDVKPDEDVVRLIHSNLARKVAWLQKVKVRTTHDKILIEADYRKPIALVKSGLRKFYV
ncbi:MAG: hypothetical protein ACE5NM_09235, partial [Sedimentisphaerales bacterium]